VKIGVISDTHGYLDPKIEKIFSGVDHILHAGDIGFASLIIELGFIAPVTAVAGNNDHESSFRETEIVELGGRKFMVHHIVNPHAPSEKVEERLERDRPAVVVFGHTHKPFHETVNGVFFFNPGYAGKPKFGAARSVALLHCDPKEIRHELIALQ
jgi:putative phosphoesterase